MGRSEDPDRLRKEIDHWQRLFVLEEIDKVRYRQEVAPLKHRLAAAANSVIDVDVERAFGLLRDFGPLWQQTDHEQQRAFVREVFTGITV